VCGAGFRRRSASSFCNGQRLRANQMKALDHINAKAALVARAHSMLRVGLLDELECFRKLAAGLPPELANAVWWSCSRRFRFAMRYCGNTMVSCGCHWATTRTMIILRSQDERSSPRCQGASDDGRHSLRRRDVLRIRSCRREPFKQLAIGDRAPARLRPIPSHPRRHQPPVEQARPRVYGE